MCQIGSRSFNCVFWSLTIRCRVNLVTVVNFWTKTANMSNELNKKTIFMPRQQPNGQAKTNKFSCSHVSLFGEKIINSLDVSHSHL